MIEAVDRIQRHTSQGRGPFERDELVQMWVVHHLEIIGEAAARVTAEARAGYPGIPWREIVGMRNALVDGYFGIDLDAVWNVVERDLTPLLAALRADLPDSPSGPAGPVVPDPSVHFRADMLRGIATLKDEIGYNPTRFAQLMGTRGAVGAVKLLLQSDSYSEGFTKLWEHKRPPYERRVLRLAAVVRRSLHGCRARRRQPEAQGCPVRPRPPPASCRAGASNLVVRRE